MKKVLFIVILGMGIFYWTFDINKVENFSFNEEIISKIFEKSKYEYLIYIKKTFFKLFVINRKGEILEIFDIAIGRKKDFGRKIHQNDNATPEGIYFITEILSADAPTNSESYKKLAKMNSIYFRAKDGYYKFKNPSEDLGTNSYGPRFFRISYPNEEDLRVYQKLLKENKIPQKKDKSGYLDIGDGIGIHGTNDPDSIGHKITKGCVRMRNFEIVLLDKYIKIGTPVFIEK